LIQLGQVADQSFAGGSYYLLDPEVYVGNGDYDSLWYDEPSETMYIPRGEPTYMWGFGFGQISDWLYVDTYPNEGYFEDLMGENLYP
jgi:hypothetical protein